MTKKQQTTNNDYCWNNTVSKRLLVVFIVLKTLLQSAYANIFFKPKTNLEEQTIVSLQMQLESMKRSHKIELEQKLKNERKNFVKLKKLYADEIVSEALYKQRIQLESRFNEILNQKLDTAECSRKEVIVQPQIVENPLKKKASLFTGIDQKACCAATVCSICLKHKVCVLYEPCMHVATCIDCVPRHIILSNKTAKCQICKSKITDFRKVFF